MSTNVKKMFIKILKKGTVIESCFFPAKNIINSTLKFCSKCELAFVLIHPSWKKNTCLENNNICNVEDNVGSFTFPSM